MRETIQRLASERGLLFLGVVGLDVTEDYARYRRWIAEGRQGALDYLERYDECRRDPERLLPGAKRALVFGLPYDLGDSIEASEPRVAQYARFPDYHRVLRRKLEGIGRELESAAGYSLELRALVDTAPLLERALAARAAEGFIGKNTCWIHPAHGSWFLLGEILTSWELAIDEKAPVPVDRKTKAGGCGPCRLCQVACPTGALDRDYAMDSRLCLSYWTIEQRGPIPERFWPHLARYYFGCDLCQLACPYNIRGDSPAPPDDWKPRAMPSLFQTATMNQAEYEQYFGGTPMTRAKRNGLRRNALIALFVTNDPRLGEAMVMARRDLESPVGETLAQIERAISEASRAGTLSTIKVPPAHAPGRSGAAS